MVVALHAGFQGQRRQQLLVVRSSTFSWRVQCARMMERGYTQTRGRQTTGTLLQAECLLTVPLTSLASGYFPLLLQRLGRRKLQHINEQGIFRRNDCNT